MTAKKKKELTFEEGLSQVEEITAAMDSGNMALEDAIRAYEEARVILHGLEEQLAGYKKRIELIDPETGEIQPLEERTHDDV